MNENELGLYYRKLMCAAIELAVQQALSHSENNTIRADAIDYINGDMFQYQMDLLGLEKSVDAVREMVNKRLSDEVYQIMLSAPDERTIRCSRCGEYKLQIEFYTDVRAQSGHHSRCKKCELQEKQHHWQQKKQEQVYA